MIYGTTDFQWWQFGGKSTLTFQIRGGSGAVGSRIKHGPFLLDDSPFSFLFFVFTGT